MGGFCSKKKVNSQDEIKESLIKSNASPVNNSKGKYKQYFQLVEENLKRYYHENRANPVNVSISLDKKDFNSNLQSKRIIINNKQKFIYWKDYLLSYLYRTSSRGYDWSHELIMLINNELFLSENKWLSLFFWQEFELRIKPKCLINLMKSKPDYNTRESNIADKVNGSFCSVNTDSLSINDPTHEYKEYRQKVRAYITIFKEHVYDQDHPINIIVRHFVKVFSQFIEDKIKEVKLGNFANKQSYLESLNDASEEITKLLQKMILKLQTTIRLMYCRTINYQYFIEERDELINLVTSLIFNNKTIYTAITNLYKVTLDEQMSVFKQKLKSLKKIRPQDLGINERFCLNDLTLAFQKKLLQEESNHLNEEFRKSLDGVYTKKELIRHIEGRMTSPVLKDPHIPESFAESYPASSQTMKLNIKELSGGENVNGEGIPLKGNTCYSHQEKSEIKVYYGGNSDLKSPLKFSTKNSYSYERAIKTLKLLNNYHVPYEKMAVIASISNEITECVNEFWREMEKIITSSLLNIDADELMSIFIYIIIKAQMPNLLIHMKMIKEFTTCITKTTMMGYYFVTLDASIIYILDLDEKNIKINRDKLRTSLMNQKSFHEYEEAMEGLNISKKTN